MGSFRPRNFADFLQVIWRRKFLILFVTAVVLTAAFVIVIKLPRIYESRAVILVSGAIYDRQANGAQIAVVTEAMTSRSNLERLVEHYGLYDYIAKLDLRVQQLQDDIKFDTKYRSDAQGFPESFTISYRHIDPAVARQIVTDLVSIFNQANATLERQALEEARSIGDELADIEARLSHTSARRAASSAYASSASRAAANIERVRTERNAIASSVDTLRDRQFALDQQIAAQKQLIVQQQEVVRSAPPEENHAGGSFGALLKRKADLEAQIADYSARFTDKYPKLVQAKEQLADVNGRIAQAGSAGEQARATVSSPAAQELRNLQRDLNRMETDLEVVRRELQRKQQAASTLPAVGGSSPLPVATSVPSGIASSTSDYSYDGLKERYTALLKRQDALREFQPSTAGPATPFFQMVDQPNLPQAAVAPNRARLMMIALAMALAVALLVAAALEARRLPMIYDDRDVDFYLGVPVVAAIPETLTSRERAQEAGRRLKIRTAYLVAGAVAVPVLILLLNVSRIFQILGSK